MKRNAIHYWLILYCNRINYSNSESAYDLILLIIDRIKNVKSQVTIHFITILFKVNIDLIDIIRSG